MDLLDGFSVRRYKVRSMNLSTFLLRSLKAEQCNFLGENGAGAGALSNKDSSLVLLLLETVNVEPKITQKTTFEAEYDTIYYR